MFKRFGIVWLSFLLLILILTACTSKEQPAPQSSSNQPNASQPAPSQKVELMVSTAATLKDAMDELKPVFEKEHPNVTLSFNFGSSGNLAQQIVQGAPSDIFLSASTKYMDTVQGKNLIEKDTRVDFAKNEIVLIAKKDSSLTVSSFENIDPSKLTHFAIGDPKTVPAGAAAKETLQKLKLWNQLQSKLVMGSDVNQVVNYVETGNAELGVVVADPMISKKVKVLAEANPEWHQPIVYTGAVIANSTHKNDAKAFVAFLSSDNGKEILKKYGFK